MARYYSKRYKNKVTKKIRQGTWVKYCGIEYWYGYDLICGRRDGMCYGCAMINYPECERG